MKRPKKSNLVIQYGTTEEIRQLKAAVEKINEDIVKLKKEK